jgi:photosystem II stability/assembly factor-like uncharacterized protein
MKKIFYLIILLSFSIHAQKEIPVDIYGGMKFRNISPGHISGRISDFAVNPQNHDEYYVGVAAGGIWKTTDNGTTFKPVFDHYPVYSIGALAIDPTNPHIIWAGTGENNHQRSVSYGNGIYKSMDGGKTWKNMGLNKSMHIGKILIHPQDGNIVYVAAEGSVWGPGGDRGLYKSEDGGKTWKRILFVSENTGINNIIMDPRNTETLYATAEQRRRRTQTRIGGGPESALYKSEDGGKNWRKITNGLPTVDKAGMGIAISPVNPDVLYLIIEAAMGKSGFYRSTNRGESWQKMSDYHTSGQYYSEIYPSPFDVNTVYSMETRSKYTTDGGKTWKLLGQNKKHVDDHAFWIDPSNQNHFIIGGDGGIYETYNHGKTYIHKENLAITQFYRASVDNSYPFYWIYGGTQDNNSLGAPTSTLYSDGISSCDWDITLGGDGFWQAIDPTNPNIVYSEYQYGNLFRYDKKSGQRINIKPREKEGEKLYKWNWNAPFILSKHNPEVLYMAANKVFKSTDRGNSWKIISDDITTKTDRNKWKVMDHYWGIDAVAKDVSTSLYGTAVSIAESPIRQGIIFVGTDDGALNITRDDGKTWRQITKFPGVPAYTYISDIEPSKFDENTVFVTFDNRKHNDLKPYILVSHNLGKTWKHIESNLPKDNSPVHTIAQDHKDKNLLFTGTEFGVYFSPDYGKKWIRLKSGLPTISIRDIAIQEREDDLVLASFGRGFFVLDNYSPLRKLKEALNEDFYLFPTKEALLYVQRNRGGYGFGHTQKIDKNKDYGAVFTFYKKEIPKTMQQQRREKEKELFKQGLKIPIPTLDEQRKEKEEIGPYLIFTIKDDQDNIVNRLTSKENKGIGRVNWNLRYASVNPVDKKKFKALDKDDSGRLVLPGDYTVDVNEYYRGNITSLVKNYPFKVKLLQNSTLPEEDLTVLDDFLAQVSEIYKKAEGTKRKLNEMLHEISSMKYAVLHSPNMDLSEYHKLEDLERSLYNIKWKFEGQTPPASSEERIPQPVPLNDRLYYLAYAHYDTTAPITEMEKDALHIIQKQFPILQKQVIEVGKKLENIKRQMDDKGVRWTPGREFDK